VPLLEGCKLDYHNRAATTSMLGFRLGFLGFVVTEISVHTTAALQVFRAYGVCNMFQCLVLPRLNPAEFAEARSWSQNLQVESWQTNVQSSVVSDSANSPVPSRNFPSVYTLPIFLVI
jgi:hypothetical protein